ncbi:MAG: lipoprotein-releasing ABC transporter permease subunit [Thermodesulfobacteriota bacterium]
MSVEAFIGWRYLKAKRRQTFISLITLISMGAVALGVAAMIVILAVMSGFENDLKSKILDVNSHVVVLRENQALTGHEELAPRIRSVPGVVSVEPFIFGQVMISAMGNVAGAVLRGVDPGLTAANGHLSRTLREGNLSTLRDGFEGPEGPAPGVILGRELAKRLALIQGDLVKIISPLGRVTPLGNRAPRVKEFRLAGQFESGMYDYDSTFAYVSLKEAQEFLSLGEAVTGLEVKVADIYRAREVKERILERLGPSYAAKDWMEMNKNLFSALWLEKVTMFIILTLTILVAAFNIIATLTMVVMEKARDIAILKAMGATGRLLMKVFIFQGLVIGGLGTVIGLMGGVGVCELLAEYEIVHMPENVFYMTKLPVLMKPLDVALITCAAVLISFLATLYPAWQASRLDPVEAMRYE